jgi:outer membrane receptor protein involved in Fe transport
VLLSASTIALAAPAGAQQASPAPAAASPAPAADSFSAPAIIGVVSSERGPLAKANVTIVGPVTKSTVTGADGTFQFTNLPAGTYRLRATAPGFQPLENTSLSASTTPQPIAITLAAASLNTLRTIASTSVAGRGGVTINSSGEAQSTISSQTFEDRGQFQVQDLLEELPGVELARFDSSAPGANVTPAVRGASPYETQTLIDGHPVSGGQYGDFLIQFLNPLALGSVEVDKGPGVFGNTIQNAVGGTVNFLTPTITSTLRGQLTTGYDSFNGSTYSARVSDTIGKLGFLAAYGFYGTPGYFSGNILSVNTATSGFAGSIPTGTVNEGIYSTETYQNRSQVFKLAYNFSPTTSLTLGAIGEQTYVDYTATLDTVEPIKIVPVLPGSPTTYNNPTYGGLVGQTVLGSTPGDNLYLGNFEYDNEPIFTGDLRTTIGPGSLLARYYTGSIDRNIDDPEEALQNEGCLNPSCSKYTPDSPYYEGEQDELRGFDALYSVPFGRDGQDIGTVSYDEHSDSSTDCSGETAAFSSLAECGSNLFRYNLDSHTFSLRAFANVLPKVRVGFANYFSTTTFVGGRYDPRATLVWTPQKNIAVRFAVGTAYVAPTAGLVAPIPGENKTVVGDILYVADALKPETSAGIDIGADFGVHGDSKFTVDGYETALTNRFSTLDLKPLTGTMLGTYNGTPFKEIEETYNFSDANEEGIEFSYVRSPRVGFGGLAEFDLLRAYNYNVNIPTLPGFSTSGAGQAVIDNEGETGETPGYQIPGYAYSHGRLELSYKFPSTAQFVFGQTIYGANNSFGEPGFSLFDFRTSLPLNYGLRVLASVSNVFNHDDYRTLGEYAYGYVPPGDYHPGVPSGVNLFFAPPRTITVQLAYPFGGR